MSTTYMVNSNLVFLACHINVVLMTILLLFNLSRSTQQSYILSVLQMMLYMLGVLFNLYVVLYASRKWELIGKYFENGINYMHMTLAEIKLNLWSSIQATFRHIVAVVSSIGETCYKLGSASTNAVSSKFVVPSPISQEPLYKKDSPFTKKDEVTRKIATRPVFLEEIAKVHESSEDNTPELKTVYNLRNISRPKSDPIKKTVKNEVVKSQSPELLKNKIFKSRMSMICATPPSSMDKRK